MLEDLWEVLRSSYYEKLPANRQVRECYQVWTGGNKPGIVFCISSWFK